MNNDVNLGADMSTNENQYEQSTSSTPDVDQLNKELQQEEAAEEANIVRCKTCFKEIAPNRRCGGHGGGGGGGGGGSTSGDKSDNAVGSSLASSAKTSSETDSANLSGPIETTDDMSAETNFDPKIIDDLINRGLLQVDNNRELKTLSINFDTDLLSPQEVTEIKKYVMAIKKELEAFKKENPNALVEFKQDIVGTKVSIRISLPTIELYDKFIQRLANNLLPTPTLKLQAEKDQEFAPTPLSMEPKPSANKDKQSTQEDVNQAEASGEAVVEVEAEEQGATFDPSPFSIKPEPKPNNE